jgi:aspartyl-tRNA synthetase
MRTLSTEANLCVGQKITVQGWVNSRRDHGGLIFIDLRDHQGILQLTIDSSKDFFNLAEQLRDEFVIEATGIVSERDSNLKNDHIDTGDIELMVSDLKIINKSEPLPILVNSSQPISEENRLKYRYLDLRRSKLQNILKKRALYYKHIRNYMEERDFTEIATPILANSSPEGARDFLVPSRVHAGKFYALPQAPQQFKQLLMVGGVHRYYQIATCFRDEDPRADRLYGDFYQLDIEMSFVEDGDIVRQTVEPLIKQLVTVFADKELVHESIPRITYKEAMNKYGSDKPDLRFGLELVDLSNELANCGFGVFSKVISSGGVVKAICVPSQFSRSQIDKLTDLAKSYGAGGLPYITVTENGELQSAISKFFNADELRTIATKTKAQPGDTIFFGVDIKEKANKVLGELRNHFGNELNLKDPNKVALAWIVDFPFYELDTKTNKLDFGHNPFSMPKGGLEVLENDNKLNIVADQYDMVMNGYEVCSGAVRNYNPDVMYRVFDVLGYDKTYVESKFGAMLQAFKYGAPPHAGCAFGLDRMFMVLMNEDNIREVVAFPKNGSGVDAMMSSPSKVSYEQLAELDIKIVESTQ